MRGIDVHAEQAGLVPFLGAGPDLQSGKPDEVAIREAAEPREARRCQTFGELRAVQQGLVLVGGAERIGMQSQRIQPDPAERIGVRDT